MALVVLYPAIFRDECINDFLHGQVGDELFLGQRAPGHRVKVAHTLQQQSQGGQPSEYTFDPSPKAKAPYLQVLLNVLAVVSYTTGCDAGLPHQLKADLATQVVRDISLLQHNGENVWNWKGHHTSTYPRASRTLTFLFSST